MSTTTMTALGGLSSGPAATASAEVRNGYIIPKWAGKPPNGLHLDVMKDGKLIQKLMIDEQRYYFFGRNKDVCEFTIDHASCSRVHAVLLWHKHLNRSFIVDLGSAHGTFVGHVQLEANKPQQLFVDSELRFGASTRSYIIREKPQMKAASSGGGGGGVERQQSTNNNNDDSTMDDVNMLDSSSASGSSRLISSLPQSEAELDNLTEYNTAHNKRIAQLVDLNAAAAASSSSGPKKKRKAITFSEEDEIINPEDVDSSVGRFRNLIQTTIVIPNKKKRGLVPPQQQQQQQPQHFYHKRTKDDDEEQVDDWKEAIHSKADDSFATTLYDDDFESSFTGHNSIASNLGIRMLDLAPDVDSAAKTSSAAEAERKQQLELLNRQHLQRLQQQQHLMEPHQYTIDSESHKKKYIKEAWPGRKPGPAAADFSSPLNPTPSTSQSRLIPSPLLTAQSFSNPTKKPFAEMAHNPPPPSSSNQQQQSSSLNPAKRLII